MVFDNVKRALFVGAHTDDEMICAGTLRRLVKAGVEVIVVTFSSARIDGTSEEESREILAGEYCAAMELLGIAPENRHLLGFPTRDLPTKQGDIRQTLYDLVTGSTFDLALIPSREDDHQDHAIVGEEAERTMRGRVNVLLRYHYPWNFEVQEPNLFVTLTEDEFEAKLRLISAYPSQRFRYNFEELFAAQSRLAGLTVKQERAETFRILRAVV